MRRFAATFTAAMALTGLAVSPADAASLLAPASLQAQLLAVYNPDTAELIDVPGTGNYAFSGLDTDGAVSTSGSFSFYYDGDRPVFDLAATVNGTNRGVTGVEAYFQLTYQFEVAGPDGEIPLDVFSSAALSLTNPQVAYGEFQLEALTYIEPEEAQFLRHSGIIRCNEFQPVQQCLDGNGDLIGPVLIVDGGGADSDPLLSGSSGTTSINIWANTVYTAYMFGTFKVLQNEGLSIATLHMDPQFTISPDFVDRELYTLSISEPVPAGGAVTPVPEPSTWGLLTTAFGLSGMALRRRRRLSAVAALRGAA